MLAAAPREETDLALPEQSRFAYPEQDYAPETSHQENSVAEEKTAPRKIFSMGSILHLEPLTQVTETHQENSVFFGTIVLGCVVAPNSSVSGAGQGTDSRSMSYPYFQQCDGTCWAASFRNYLHNNGISDARIPSEEEVVAKAKAALLANVPSPLWNSENDHLARITQQGISKDEAESIIVPLAADFGVESKIYPIDTSSINAPVAQWHAKFDKVLGRGNAVMVNVPASTLSATEGVGHFVVMQQGGSSVNYVDPRDGSSTSISTGDAWHRYSGWSISGGGYLIAPVPNQ